MKYTLITGVSGEIGTGLVENLKGPLIGVDVREPEPEQRVKLKAFYKGDISDPKFIEILDSLYQFDTIFHLAGILSSGGEKNPLLAHSVNVNGTLNLLELARKQTETREEPVKFIFTSTIAVYGIPTLEEKQRAKTVKEEAYLSPITMYGANKLYCEKLGTYYSKNFGMLEGKQDKVRIDFRSVRFPGILSAHTIPTGGTSDYAPQMVHAVAQNKPAVCFVRPDARIPFMVMPDAIRALTMLASAKRENLTQSVYNVTSFSPSAEEIAALLKREFQNTNVTYEIHPERQKIVDSWPENIDDSKAKKDWGWTADYSLGAGFFEYLVPGVIGNYTPSNVANA